MKRNRAKAGYPAAEWHNLSHALKESGGFYLPDMERRHWMDHMREKHDRITKKMRQKEIERAESDAQQRADEEEADQSMLT